MKTWVGLAFLDRPPGERGGKRWCRLHVGLTALILTGILGGCGAEGPSSAVAPADDGVQGLAPRSGTPPSVAGAGGNAAAPLTASTPAQPVGNVSAPVSASAALLPERAGLGGAPPVAESAHAPAEADGWCEVRDILAANCTNCHAEQPVFGAPMALTSHADLMATAPSDGRPTFEAVLDRVRDDARPMPPAPAARLAEAEVAKLAAWMDAGAPAGGDCGALGGTTAPAEGGTVVDDPNCIDCGTYSCEDGTPMRFLAHGEEKTDDTTPFDASEVGGALSLGDPNYYACFYFKAPWGENAIASGFRPVVDNSRVLHHWLLYASPNAPGDLTDGGVRGECQLQSDQERILLGGWAPGVPGRRFPEDIGQELPFGPNTYVTLEVHYYNAKPGEDAPDRSGGELCLAPAPRPNVATQHWLGTEKIFVPPGESATTGDTCTPRLTAGQTSTLLSVTPHMHEAGRHAKLEVLRAGGTMEVLHDSAFQFDNQVSHLFDPPVVLNAQDRLRASCTYENVTDFPIGFGDGTGEEMCYLYVTAYPAGSLNNGLNGCTGPFCVPGADRRCIDNENILDAIGGL